MQKVRIDNIAQGAIIAQDVHANDGRMLISRGAQYRGSFLSRLESAGIFEVFIEDAQETVKDLIFPEPNPIERLQQDIHIDDVIYEKTRKQAEHQVMKIMVRLGSMRQASLDKLFRVVDNIMEQLLARQDLVLSLSKLRSIDDYTYEHSVNVCVISILIGIDLFMEKNALRELGIGAILHDIGKVGVSERIIKKPGRLNPGEFDEIKRHTELGYQILKGAGFDEDVARIALYHHERIDGSGYPHHLEGKAIPLFARVVAIADFYDAISNNRIYRRRMTPDDAYREIIKTSTNHLDETLVEKFLRHIHMYPIGCGVMLNSLQKGVVIRQNRLMPESPVVRVFMRESGRIVPRYVDVDLSAHPSLFITGTF
jgi:putative nucleotidyltransferase with HDIG domain